MKDRDISVLPLGTVVTFGIDLSGTITGVCIRKGRIEYEVRFWIRDERKTVWLDEDEMTPVGSPERYAIGFVRPACAGVGEK